MADSYYLIDQRLGVKSLTSLLTREKSPWDNIRRPSEIDGDQVVGGGSAPNLPVTPDGELHPGVLYPSSADPQVRFYLPQYRLNEVDGHYTTSLKWRGANDDPNGPLAFLTIEVIGIVPPSGGFALQEIPHQALARIAYQMPVQSEGPDGAPREAGPVLWIEVGALTRKPVMQTLVRIPGSNTASVLSARLALSSKSDFDRLYQVMTDSRFNGRLQISCFATAGRRTWRQVVLGHIGLTAQTNALKKDVLVTDMIAEKSLKAPLLQTPLNTNTRKIALSEDPGTPVSLTQALKLVNLSASQLATSDQPPDLPPPTVKKLSLNLQTMRTANPLLFKGTAVPPAGEPPVKPAAKPLAKTLPTMKLARPVLGRLTLSPAAAGQPTAAMPSKPATAVPAAGSLNARVVRAITLKPVLSGAYARPLPQVLTQSDVVTRIGRTDIKALPVKAVVAEDGQPALMRISVETRQEITPFFFSLDTNANMFDIPGDLRPGKNHVLIRMEVRDAGGQVTGVFYQDSAYTDQFYYQPQEFRLSRTDAPPYLPDMKVVFLDLVTQDDETDSTEASLNYKVRLVYRVQPHIDPLMLDLAQQQVPEVQARFSALAPETTRLSLQVPEDETNGSLTEVPRPGVEVRFDQAIIDNIELSRTEFERIFAFFQAPGSVGLEGTVEATLLGSQTARVPVYLSLAKTAGSVFSHAYLGPQGNGIHRVRLINRIESPVSIDALHRVALGGSVFAFPQTSTGQVVAPGGQLDLDYRLDPADAVVADIPPVLSTSIQVDPLRLWPQIFINQGYTSDTFTLQLTITPDFFGLVPPGAVDTLTGVRVEFDDETSVTLTADCLQSEVELRIPLLPRLMGDPQAEQYRYRVGNLLGADAHPGGKTDWISGQGGAPLQVLPAGV